MSKIETPEQTCLCESSACITRVPICNLFKYLQKVRRDIIHRPPREIKTTRKNLNSATLI